MKDDLKSADEPDESVTVRIDKKQTKKALEPDTDSFLTPDQMAAVADVAEIPDVPEVKPPKIQGWKAKIGAHMKAHRRAWLVGSSATFVLSVAAMGFFFESLPKPQAAATPVVHSKSKVIPVSDTVASTLSGLPVTPAVNQRPVTGVMVENSELARPQSGLSQASVVFEAIAEGGITRFLALYQDTAPDDVGPIRSARPYYEQWALGFDAGYAHVGGSPEALADIKAWGVRDLDQFANGGSYHRINSREAPHNVYTSISTLTQLEASKGYTTSKYTGFVRKAAAPAKAATARSISMTISSADFNTHYDYNAATNSYDRSEAGAPQVDASGNVQISPKVVVAMVMPYSLEADGYHSNYNTVGSGTAYVFQDGIVTTGSWSKKDAATQFSFTDAAGKPIKLNAGQTWLTALRGTNEISYSP